jgi:DNA-directed RNA polymerase subunit RPC12/RpoP
VKFYFCEKCGKRITETDIEHGLGKDKKLTGVYCRNCAVGVLTIETLPMSPEQAREILRAAGHAHGAISEGRFSAGRTVQPSAKTKGAPLERRSAIQHKWLVGAACAAVLVAVLLLVFLSRGGRRLTGDSDSALRPAPTRLATVQPPPPDTSNQPASTLPQAMPTKPEDNDSSQQGTGEASEPSRKPEGLQQTEVPQTGEQIAQEAFEALTRVEGLGPEDKAGRIMRLEEFLRKHGETIVAARARVLLAELKGAKPTAQSKGNSPEAASAHSSPPVAADGNLVPNPSAEEVDGQRPVAWGLYRGDHSDTGFEWGATDGEAHSGKRCVYYKVIGYPKKDLHNNGIMAGGCTNGYTGENAIKVQPKTRYCFSFWLKGTGFAAPVLINIQSWDGRDLGSEGRKFLTSSPDKVVVPSDWGQFEGHFDSGAETERVALKIWLSMKAAVAPPGAVLYVDDVYLGVDPPNSSKKTQPHE